MFVWLVGWLVCLFGWFLVLFWLLVGWLVGWLFCLVGWSVRLFLCLEFRTPYSNGVQGLDEKVNSFRSMEVSGTTSFFFVFVIFFVLMFYC